MDGVSLAKHHRRRNETLYITFITGYDHYISEGYEVAAPHYLMKPVKGEKLLAILNRAADRLRYAERVMALESDREKVRVPLCQIRYINVHLKIRLKI